MMLVKGGENMPDIEKVIEGLEKAKVVIETWIPMFEQYNSPFTIDCAIELLKVQQLDIEALKNTIQSMVEGQCVIAGSKQPQIVRCKDCKHFEIKDHWANFGGVPILATSDCPTCNKWADGCMTKPDGYCFMAERRD